jgi:hypothetical protein
MGRTFENASSVNIGRCEVGREQCVCTLSRPAGGGPICMLAFVAGDMRDLVPTIDLRQRFPDLLDAFDAHPFVSNIDQTLKAFVWYKPDTANGNDRTLAVVSTWITPEVTR